MWSNQGSEVLHRVKLWTSVIMIIYFSSGLPGVKTVELELLVWLCFCSKIFLNCSPIFVIELSWGKERSTNSREVSNNRVMMQQVAKNLFISRNGTIKTCKCQRMSCKGQKGSWKCVSKPWNDSQKPGAANVWCCVQASVGMTSHCAHCPHTSAIVARRSPRVTQYQV